MLSQGTRAPKSLGGWCPNSVLVARPTPLPARLAPTGRPSGGVTGGWVHGASSDLSSVKRLTKMESPSMRRMSATKPG